MPRKPHGGVGECLWISTVPFVIQAPPMPKRETRDRRVNLRLSKRLVQKVEAAAKAELRSLNSMFEVIVSAWAAKR
jgi:predicted HicB family RNase H-like nuclease